LHLLTQGLCDTSSTQRGTLLIRLILSSILLIYWCFNTPRTEQKAVTTDIHLSARQIANKILNEKSHQLSKFTFQKENQTSKEEQMDTLAKETMGLPIFICATNQQIISPGTSTHSSHPSHTSTTNPSSTTLSTNPSPTTPLLRNRNIHPLSHNIHFLNPFLYLLILLVLLINNPRIHNSTNTPKTQYLHTSHFHSFHTQRILVESASSIPSL
jgi:hypothetical protein